MKPIKTLRALFRLSILFVTLIVYVTFYIIRSFFIKPTVERGFRLKRAWVKIAMRVLNIRVVEFIGSFPDYPALYVMNHRNLIDPVVMAHFVDLHFLAKEEVSKLPFMGKGAEFTGVIYVKRDERNSRLAARETLHETLKKGLSIGVYPEGTTGIEETSINFHKGSFEEAAKLEVPVVAIACEYKNKSDLWIEPSLLRQFLIQFGKRETQVKIEVHPPLKSTNATFLMRESRKQIDNSLIRMHENWHQLWGNQTESKA